MSPVKAMQAAQEIGMPQTGVRLAEMAERGQDVTADLDRARAVRDRLAAFKDDLPGADVGALADRLAARGFSASEAAQVVDEIWHGCQPDDDVIDTSVSASAAGGARLSRPLASGADQTYDNPDFLARQMGEALAVRVDPAARPSEAARPFVGASLPDLLRHGNELRGIRPASASPAATVQAALQGNNDFTSALIGDFANRVLRQAYEPAENSLVNASREIEARDFRAVHAGAAGTFPELKKVNEHGEFTRGPLASEGGELLRLETYGRTFGVTRQALVNDDLSGLFDSAQRVAVTVQDFIASQLASLIESNPNFFDGTPIFDSGHGNLAASGGAITVGTLSAAREALRKQKAVGDDVFIRIEPAFIVVAPDRETEAQQVVAQVTPSTATEANPFAGALRVLVDPRLADGAWYVAADPQRTAGLHHAFLSDERGPQTETRAGFEFDGVEVRVRLDFGAGWGDFRPWFKNPGA